MDEKNIVLQENVNGGSSLMETSPFCTLPGKAGDIHGAKNEKQALKKAAWTYRAAKRLFDVSSSLALLLVSWPLFCAVAIAIKREDGGPVFYRHTRVGQNGKLFSMWKFRTMVQNADAMISRFTAEQQTEWAANFKLRNDPRITRTGRTLRRASLDELPQIFNILAGDMSVIGPRPIVAEELAKYGDRKDRLLTAKPGLIGYWQAYARSNVGYENGERQHMELHYVQNMSPWMDVKIFFQSIAAVFRGNGAM